MDGQPRSRVRRFGLCVALVGSLSVATLSPVGIVAAQAASAPAATAAVSVSMAASPSAKRTTTKKKLTLKQRKALKRAKAKAAAKRKAALAAAARKATLAAAKKKPTPTPTPTPTPAPPPPASPTPAPVPTTALSVTSFGAIGDGVTDNCTAINNALSAVGVGGTLLFPAGQVFAHSCVLQVAKAGVRLTGGGQLKATNERRSSLFLNAASVSVDNLKFTIATTSQRWEEYEQMRIRVGAVSGVTISDVTVDGSAAAGIYVGGASNFSLNRVEVKNTRADAIHMTESARDGAVTDATIRNAGDDGVAVVTYGASTTPAKNITVTRPRLYGQTWGRAFSVVGGDRITFKDIYAEQSSGATVYIASEGGGYNTGASTNVLVDGGAINQANQTSSVDHGAVMLYNGRSAVNSDITVKNLTITNTRASASRQIGIVQDSGGTHQRVTLQNIAIFGGPTPLGGNAPLSAYNRIGLTYNGVALANLIGWS